MGIEASRTFASTLPLRRLSRLVDAGSHPTVIDEFTSVVDRRVAQIGCAAVAKTVRRRQQQLLADCTL